MRRLIWLVLPASALGSILLLDQFLAPRSVAQAAQPRFVTVPTGLDLAQVAELMERSGVADANSIVEKAQDPALVKALGIEGDSLEGYLFGGTYPFDNQAPVEVHLRTMVMGFRSAFGPEQRTLATKHGWSQRQVVAMASSIERHAGKAKRYGLIAGVIHNRLKRNWPSLRGMPRVIPETPLCSPGKAAIDAALNPETTDRLFLFADPDGSLGTDLQDSERRALAGIRWDRPPKKLSKETHFLVSDERRHVLFQDAIRDTGGVFIGVGTDQNYLMAGWARPDILVLLDFDQWVVNLHDINRVVFLHARTPEEFVELWSKPKNRELRRLIRDAYPSKWRRHSIMGTLSFARWVVYHRLLDLRDRYAQGDFPIYLTDDETYAYFVGLHRAGRVLAVRGDLTARRTMRQLGRVLRENARVVRLLYLSNAEQYFTYSKQFRLNIRELPADERSLILRTRPTGFDYTYIIQPYGNFLEWLSKPHIRNVRHIFPRKALSRKRPFVRFDADAPERRVRRRARKRARP